MLFFILNTIIIILPNDIFRDELQSRAQKKKKQQPPPAGLVTSLGAKNKAQNKEERRDGGYFKTYSGLCQALVKRKTVKYSEPIRLPLK